jgi:hypothetical protein
MLTASIGEFRNARPLFNFCVRGCVLVNYFRYGLLGSPGRDKLLGIMHSHEHRNRKTA